MSVIIPDLHIKYVLQFALSELRANPDLFLPDIFGNLTVAPHSALFGEQYLAQIKTWMLKTDFPVILGYPDPATHSQFPCISITLSGANPDQSYLGDRVGTQLMGIQEYQRDVLVPSFQPADVTYSADKSYAVLTLPSSMPQAAQYLFFPGCHIRDAKKQEFILSTDTSTKPRIDAIQGGPPVTSIDSTSLEVISPYSDAQYTTGGMWFRYNLNITVYANNNRQDGLWLWTIIMWALLRNRSLMTSLFGFDLAMPSSGEYFKDPSLQPENLWIRTITLSTQAMWSWLDTKQTDILGFITYLNANRPQ